VPRWRAIAQLPSPSEGRRIRRWIFTPAVPRPDHKSEGSVPLNKASLRVFPEPDGPVPRRIPDTRWRDPSRIALRRRASMSNVRSNQKVSDREALEFDFRVRAAIDLPADEPGRAGASDRQADGAGRRRPSTSPIADCAWSESWTARTSGSCWRTKGRMRDAWRSTTPSHEKSALRRLFDPIGRDRRRSREHSARAGRQRRAQRQLTATAANRGFGRRSQRADGGDDATEPRRRTGTAGAHLRR
jgi:hypothetical protein